MSDIVERLRSLAKEYWQHRPHYTEAADEIERLRAAISRIDAINDNPADYNSEINAVCDSILRPAQALTPEVEP